MSLLGNIGKIGAGVAGVGLAPWTGGLSLGLIPGVVGGVTAASGIHDLLAHKDGAPGAAGAKPVGSGKTSAAAGSPTDVLQNTLQTNAAATRAQGSSQSARGQAALAPLMRTLQALASGDPTALLAATGPERRRVLDQYDTARRSLAEFGPRGGGSSAAIAKSEFDEIGDINDLIAGRQDTAQQLLAQLASNDVSQGNQLQQSSDQQLQALLSLLVGKDLTHEQMSAQNKAAIFSALGEGLGSILSGWLAGKSNN